jgi:acyl dehydratase
VKAATTKTLYTFDYTIERGKIREFAQAIGDPNPIYHDIERAKEEGFKDIPIPPTFPTVMEMWGGLDFDGLIRLLQLDPLRVLHGEQSYEYLQDVCANETLHATLHLKQTIDKPTMKIFVLETTYKNEQGETVLTGTSTVLERKGGDKRD